MAFRPTRIDSPRAGYNEKSQPGDFIDPSILKEIEDSGFSKKL
jgi:hypothetical protein